MSRSAIAWGAVGTLARHELRVRRRTLLALALACGLFAGAALGVATVLWRTDSAYSRLVAASALDDVRVTINNQYLDALDRPAVVAAGNSSAAAFRARPDVRASATVGQFVGRVHAPGVVYTSIGALYQLHPAVARPVIIRGRLPAAGRADEVAVQESAGRAQHLTTGSHVSVDLLTNTQYLNFSTGVGRPAGGHVDLRVVGVFRYPKPTHLYNSLIAGPAFAAAHPGDSAGTVLALRTRHHVGPGAFSAQAAAVNRTMTGRFGAGQTDAVLVEGGRGSPDPGIGATRAVLRAGLLALTVVLAAAGLIVGAQVAGRWATSERHSQEIEHALGLTARERAAARLLAALPALLLLGALAGTGALVGGAFQPVGSLSRYEPSPGWLPRPLIAVVGAAVAVLAAAGTVFLAALRSRARARAQAAPRRLRRPLPLGRVSSLAAALTSGRGGAGTTMPTRSMVTGLAAMLAVLVVVADLHPQLSGLSGRPATWGWTADLEIVDDTPAVDRQVVAEPATRDVERLVSASLRISRQGRARTLNTYGRTTVRGALPWTLAAGRVPARPDEIALGPRAAHDLHASVGDRVQVDRVELGSVTFRVVGLVVLPIGNSEPLGSNALLTGAELTSLGANAPYSGLLVRATDRAAADRLRAEWSRRYEVDGPAPPDTVSALDELSEPTLVLLAVLLLAVTLLVAQNVRMLLRRRRSQLAVAEAIGMSGRDLVAVTCAAVLLLSGAAAAIGLPLGWAVSRLVLAEIGPRLGLPLHAPALLPVLLAGAALLAVSVVVAAVSAGYATARRRLLLPGD